MAMLTLGAHATISMGGGKRVCVLYGDCGDDIGPHVVINHYTGGGKGVP